MIVDRAADASSYFLGRLLRTREKYIMAKAASSTPPTIKIEVVTMAHFSSAGPYSLRPRNRPVNKPPSKHEARRMAVDFTLLPELRKPHPERRPMLLAAA